MFRLCAALTGALLLAPQQSDEPTLADELSALIAKTNTLESFHLVYDMESTVDDKVDHATMELIYRAPDLARIRMSVGGDTFDQWVHGAQVFLHQDGPWKRASLDSLPHLQLLDGFFPPANSEAGVCVYLTLKNRQDEQVEFSLSCGYYTSGRRCLLGWLEDLESWSGVVRDGSSLMWEDDGLRCRVSRESGLLEEVEVSKTKGHMHLVLRESNTDGSLEEDLVTLPDEALSAPEDEAMLKALLPRTEARRKAYRRVAEWLDSGEHRWDELASNHWRTVLEALHRHEIIAGYRSWLATIHEQVQHGADSARAERDRSDSADNQAEFERHVADARKGLGENLDRGKKGYFDSLVSVDVPGLPGSALADIEHEVVEALWSELMSEPVLTELDEAFNPLLGK